MTAEAEPAARPRPPATDAPNVSGRSSRTPSFPRHNLPAALSSFVGRERESAEVARLLESTRLLTITGSGGVGKTRLALKAAGDVAGRFSDGVRLVELAPLSEGSLLVHAVAKAVEAHERPDLPLPETLADFLSPKEMLLVLDNAEHLTEACARLVETILSSCPRLRVLATSREPLSVAGETVWRVPFLSIPGAGHSSVENIEELRAYESVRLFEERARSRLPEFVLAPENAKVVIGICRGLEGIPLAIELAAARMTLLSVEQISTRLTDSLGLLKGGRGASSRQRTLRATLEWSHDLLDEKERTLFHRLSVFAGSWTLEAAEGVAAHRGVEREDVLDLLGSLVDKSVVISEAGPDGMVRCRMLEPVRQFARERLEEAGEEDDLRRAHRDWCLAFVRKAEEELIGAEQGEWMDRLEAEHEDLRSALAFSLEAGEAEKALVLGGSLWLFWYTHGHYSEGRRWLELSLEATDESAKGRAKALNGLGNLVREQGDYERAETLHEHARALYEKAAGKEGGVAWSLGFLGLVARYRCEYDEAAALYERSLAIFRRLGNERGAAFALFWLGSIERTRGRHAKAVSALEEGLELFRSSREVWGVAAVLNVLGSVKRALGDFDEAGSLIEEGLGMARALGDRKMTAVALNEFGLMMRDLGEPHRAVDLLKESLGLCLELDDKRGAAECMESLASAVETPARSVRLFGAARRMRAEIGAPSSPAEITGQEACLAKSREILGEDDFERARSEGEAMSREEAVEHALAEEETSESSVRESRPASGPLTRRELEVLRLLAQGKTNRQISAALLFSVGTAKIHVRHILAKLGVSDRTRAAVRAHELGLLEE